MTTLLYNPMALVGLPIPIVSALVPVVGQLPLLGLTWLLTNMTRLILTLRTLVSLWMVNDPLMLCRETLISSEFLGSILRPGSLVVIV